jgi:hypothetical protein
LDEGGQYFIGGARPEAKAWGDNGEFPVDQDLFRQSWSILQQSGGGEDRQ